MYNDENFSGGAKSPQFTKRIADFLRYWRKRNNKWLCKPTSTGQSFLWGRLPSERLAVITFTRKQRGYLLKMFGMGTKQKSLRKNPQERYTLTRARKMYLVVLRVKRKITLLVS